MKKNLYKAIFLLLLISCKTQYATNKDADQMRESYLYAFKMSYFKKLLIEGFNNSNAIKDVIAFDRSGYGEPILLMEDYKLIDSLVKIDNKLMMQDSLNRIGRVAEGVQGKHIFDYALNKYQSKWLDSLTKERFKIYKRKEAESDK
jgi:hypothetical protein